MFLGGDSYKVNGHRLFSYSSGLVSCCMVPDDVTGLGNLAQRQGWDAGLTQSSLLFPISLIFGALTVATGIIGVMLGAEASRRYKKVNPRAEPLICASSLFATAPCLYLALILASRTLLASYVSEVPSGSGWEVLEDIGAHLCLGAICTDHSFQATSPAPFPRKYTEAHRELPSKQAGARFLPKLLSGSGLSPSGLLTDNLDRDRGSCPRLCCEPRRNVPQVLNEEVWSWLMQTLLEGHLWPI